VRTVRVAASAVGHFLADSGSDCSILPKSFAKICQTDSNASNPVLLFAANNTPIEIFGRCTLKF
jgi:hypothetical protein